MRSSVFNEIGIPIYKVTGGYPISAAIRDHPELIPFLRTQNPPRIDNTNRDALLLYNYYIAKEKFGLEIEFEKENAIIPTPMMRYSFLKYLFTSDPSNKTLIEIGTGASAIIAMLAAKVFHLHVIATEMDPSYLEYAKRNIVRNQLELYINLIDSKGNFFDNVIPHSILADFIISNPPYYDSIRSPKFLWGGQTHELLGNGDSGEGFILRMIREGWKYLKTPGTLAFIIPKTRQDTLISVDAFLNTHGFDFDIFGLKAGNRTRFVFRIYKTALKDIEFLSELD